MKCELKGGAQALNLWRGGVGGKSPQDLVIDLGARRRDVSRRGRPGAPRSAPALGTSQDPGSLAQLCPQPTMTLSPWGGQGENEDPFHLRVPGESWREWPPLPQGWRLRARAKPDLSEDNEN